MGLAEQHIAFKFTGGIETKMDSKAVPAVRLLALENGVFHRASSIKKRNGYSILSRAIDGSSSLIEGAKRLAKRDDELLLFTTARCYSKQTAADQWSDAGALVAPTGFERPAVQTGTAQTSPDHATSNGVTVHAWEDSLGGVWWTCVDATSGRVFRAPTQANANAQRPRCAPNGDVLHIYYTVPAQRQVCVLVVNPSTPSADVTEQVVVSDLDTTYPVYDACPTTRAGSPTLIGWHEFGTFNIRVAYVTAGGALGSPGNGHPSAGRARPFSVSASWPAQNVTILAVAYKYVDGADGDLLLWAANGGHDGVTAPDFFPTDDPAGLAGMLNGGTTAVAIGSTVDARVAMMHIPVDPQRVALGEADGTVWAVFEEIAAEPTQKYCTINYATISGSLLQQPTTVLDPAELYGTTLRSVGLASRAFAVDDDVFAMFVHDATYFNTNLTLRLSDLAPAGRHWPASAAAPERSHLPSVHVSDSVAICVVPYKTRLESEDNDKFTTTGIGKVVMDFDSEDSHQTAQLLRGLYLAAACPQHYDGYKWTEQGFHVGPEYVPTAVAAGGSLTVGSTYQYKVWYEWTDKQGEIHRGPESVGINVTTGGADTQVTLTLPTLRVTRKDNVRICVARSLPGDVSRHWRVSSLDPTTEGDVNGYVANDTTTDSVSFVDQMSDVNLQLQEQVYTVGGILSNDPVPLGSHVAVGKNRLFFTDAQADNVVRFSKRVATGFAAEIAPEMQHDIDPLGGDITALSTMDDVVYVFKAGAIFAFNGDGPFEDGANTNSGLVAGFSSSQLITSDVGCTDPSSIVLTPQGLMFKSTKGIRLLTRSREVIPIGDPVESYNAQTVRRATVMPDRTAVLFLTDDGSALYFDYQFGQWSTFTNHEGYDACVVDNTYYYLRTNDTVYEETIGEHSDAGRRIPLRLETAWLHLHEHLQGFQRFWKLLLLGTRVSPHQFAVSHRMNYDEAWTEPYYLDATGDTDDTGWITGEGANPIGEDPITGTVYGEGDYGEGVYGGTGPDVYQWRYGIHEDGQAVQFRFEDYEKAGLAGASFELTEMTIIGGVKKPDIRPFSAARST